MNAETGILILTAASIGFFHTLLGPDHYIPFIAMAKARNWSLWKTSIVTFLCGIGHVGSSILIGIVGIAFGVAINQLVSIESSRGSIAAWLMIGFGLLYTIWGIRRAIKNKTHSHFHQHEDGTVHDHKHNHHNEHVHVHPKRKRSELTPWILFTIFVFGPCEPFIPLLLYPAAQNNVMSAVLVTLTFCTVTVVTMLLVVTLSVRGLNFLPKLNLERYMHAIAGLTILLCGVSVQFLGL